MTSIQPELAIPATIYRVSQTEKSIKELQAEFLNMKASLTSALEQIQVSAVMKSGLTVGKTPQKHEILVPDQLRHTRGKRFVFRGKRVYGRKNRDAEKVAERWSLWKTQMAMGIPISVIARAWGCHHASILHAQKKGFVAYAKAK
jgi:hypothetical protein